MRLASGYDVAIIGGGVIGTAIAARVSRTSASVCLLERAHDLCEGASKGNAGVTVSHMAAPGTPEAALVAASHPRWEDIGERLDVPFSRVGALIVALDEQEQSELQEIARKARAAGAPAARVLDRDEALRAEPLLNPAVTGAVLLPDEGIIDSLRLVFAYASLAAINGADIVTECEAVGFNRAGGRLLEVNTNRGSIAVRFVVNATGLRVGELSALAGGEQLRAAPRQGQYWVLDPEWGRRLSRILIPVTGPAPQTRGVQVIPTTSGAALIGPTTEDTVDPDDTATDAAHMTTLFEHARRLVADVDGRQVIKSFAANRVVVGEDSLLLERDPRIANLVHASNRAIGLSCSPAIAEETLRLLRQAGLQAHDRLEAVDRLPRRARLSAIAERHPRDVDPVAAPLDARHGRVVCLCAQVGENEIRAALSGPVPARSLDGVRKRTGAMAGRCQGALCLAEIAQVCSEELTCALGALAVGPAGTRLGVDDGP